ncbi:hypothetical protein [Streptomyces sp. NBC_00648]|uniref:hypothetical protein n=1 Tax=Streptomyces sp. NBC_00648 TaxID=2975797 RepID=UPI0032498974
MNFGSPTRVSVEERTVTDSRATEDPTQYRQSEVCKESSAEGPDGRAWAPAQFARARVAAGGCYLGLYACVSGSRRPDAVLDALRKCATSQQRTVTAAVYDVGPLDRAKGKRTGLPRALRLLEDGRIQGLLPPSSAHLAAATPLREPAAVAFIRFVQLAEAVSP